MRIHRFSFKNEAAWMVMTAVAPVILGFLILFIGHLFW